VVAFTSFFELLYPLYPNLQSDIQSLKASVLERAAGLDIKGEGRVACKTFSALYIENLRNSGEYREQKRLESNKRQVAKTKNGRDESLHSFLFRVANIATVFTSNNKLFFSILSLRHM